VVNDVKEPVSVQQQVEALIDKFDGSAAREAWKRAADAIRTEGFDYWYEVATILQSLEGS
jgi:hypothetical protein